MKLNKLSFAFYCLILIACPLASVSQIRMPTVDARQSLAPVTRTTTGDYWATAQNSASYSSVCLRVITTGTPTACKLAVLTGPGPTAALATVLPDSPKGVIDCTAAEANHVVRSLDTFFNVKLETLSGGSSPSVQVYATLTAGFSEGAFASAPVSTVSAAVATATLTEVVAAPATGSIYLSGLEIEKSTGAAGTVTVQYGTGTNCDTGTTVLFGPVTNPQIGKMKVGIRVPAAKALCLQTDAATTLVRAFTN